MSAVWEMRVVDPAARLRRIGRREGQHAGSRVTAAEVAFLLLIGAATALLRSFVSLQAGIPGHSIVLIVLPLVLGLACVPRRGAGKVMSATAALTVLGIGAVGVRTGVGSGALTSLLLTGVLLDAALRVGRKGWMIYLGCISAGLLSNVVAFGVRLALKYAALAPGDALHPLATWLPRAAWSYPLCGAAAGLASAVLLFRLRERGSPG